MIIILYFLKSGPKLIWTRSYNTLQKFFNLAEKLISQFVVIKFKVDIKFSQPKFSVH